MEYEKMTGLPQLEDLITLKNELAACKNRLSEEIGACKFVASVFMFVLVCLSNYIGASYQSDLLGLLTMGLFIGTIIGISMLNGDDWNNKLINDNGSWLYRFFKTRRIKKVQQLEATFNTQLEELADKLKEKPYQYDILDYLSKASSNTNGKYNIHLERLTQQLINHEYLNSANSVVELMEVVKDTSREFKTKSYLEELKKAVVAPKLIDRL